MPEATLEQALGATENGTPGYSPADPGRDFYGLSGACPASPQLPSGSDACTEIVYRRSTDQGRTWTTWRTEPFQGIEPTPYTPAATLALSDGSLIRRVNGDDLRNVPNIPYTAMLQVLTPNRDGTYPANWPPLGGAGQVVASDSSVCKYQISRIRKLRDGRLIALGQAWRHATGHSGRCNSDAFSELLLVAASESAAKRGQWMLGMPYVSASTLSPDEWDAAQLANGDLLALFRTAASGRAIRRQAILRAATGSSCPDSGIACWVLDTSTLGNPGNLQHSGHPELLATREGVIVEFASDGVKYTVDGSSWTTLGGVAATDYYPRSIQNADGGIYVFSHRGSDDAYGGVSTADYCCVAQSITMQKFQLGR
jgi:hypothetical protein